MIEHHRTETIVRERYAASAKSPEAELCCPVNYESEYLKVIPSEVIERDYGCGDPSRYLREGETVLDLGSGTGKICFIAAQIVGPKGKVIGIDMTDEMLEVAAAMRRSSRSGLVMQMWNSGKVVFRILRSTWNDSIRNLSAVRLQTRLRFSPRMN